MDAVKKGKKTCDHPGCTSRRTVGVFCSKHQADGDGVEAVQKLTELEALKWAKLDTEMRNALQGIRLADMEVVEAKRAFLDLRNVKELEKQKLQAMVAKIRPEYEQLVDELGKKYGIEPKSMAIDPDTRVIRDLSDKKSEDGP
jgi:hypothetical protein